MEELQRLLDLVRDTRSRTAADELIRLHYEDLFRHIYRKVGNREDAMDLTQESFIAMLKGIQGYSGDAAGFRSWLYRIAINKVIDFRRRPVRETVPVEETQIAEEGDFVQELLDRELLLRCVKQVAAMDGRTKELVRLRIYEMKSFPEIAEETGEPEGTLRARYHRLMVKLRKEVRDEELP